MSKHTERGGLWELWKSLYVLFAFLYIPFISFFLIGGKTRYKKWTLFGFVYLAIFFVSLAITPIALIYYVVGIVHVFLVKKEYLIRLDVLLQSNALEEESQILREKISKEYNQRSKAITSNNHADYSPQINQVPKSVNKRPQSAILPLEFDHIKKLQELSMQISNGVARGYMNEITNIVYKISEQIEYYPERENLIRSYKNIYLPEVIKLFETYHSMCQNPLKDININNSIIQIEKELPTILEAFRNIYNNLLNSASVDLSNDISTDLKVLKDLFSQDGLTGDNMHI